MEEKEYKLETNKYGCIDDGCMPEGWKITGLTVTQLNKAGIPHYKKVVGFNEYHNMCSAILANIIPNDFEQAEKDYIKALEERKAKAMNRQPKEIKITLELLARALYSVNKEAKRQRDIKERHARNVYGDDEYEGYYYSSRKQEFNYIRNAKESEEDCYYLKDAAITKMKQDYQLTPIGYHNFPDRKRDYYEIAGYGFHINENISNNCLGEIEDHITAEKKKREMTFNRAKEILSIYINN